MYYNKDTMKKFFFIIFFILIVCTFSAFSDEGDLCSKVVTVNPEEEVFIIKAGEDIGVEMDDKVIVHRNYEKIAEGYVIGVKQAMSAVEIFKLTRNKQIQEGDTVAIIKSSKKIKTIQRKPKKKAERPREKYYTKPPSVTKKSKWALLGSEPGETPPSTKTLSKWQTGSAHQEYYYDVTEEAEPITIDIDKDSQTVFSYESLVLREKGYSITSSNRATGILVATKPVELSLLKELWADALASIDHKIILSFDIKPYGDYSNLTLSFFKEHFQKGNQIKKPVMKNSEYYTEFTTLVSEIKERSEY